MTRKHCVIACIGALALLVASCGKDEPKAAAKPAPAEASKAPAAAPAQPPAAAPAPVAPAPAPAPAVADDGPELLKKPVLPGDAVERLLACPFAKGAKRENIEKDKSPMGKATLECASRTTDCAALLACAKAWSDSDAAKRVRMELAKADAAMGPSQATKTCGIEFDDFGPDWARTRAACTETFDAAVAWLQKDASAERQRTLCSGLGKLAGMLGAGKADVVKPLCKDVPSVPPPPK